MMSNLKEAKYYSKDSSLSDLAFVYGWSILVAEREENINTDLEFYLIENVKIEEFKNENDFVGYFLIYLDLFFPPTGASKLDIIIKLYKTSEIVELAYLIFENLKSDSFQHSHEHVLELLKQRIVKKNRTHLMNYHEIFKLIDFVLDHLGEDISSKVASDYMCMHPSTLNRICQEHLRMSYKKLVIIFKINEAKLLLESTRDPLCEVAEKVGFLKLSSFSKFFRSIEGVSPTQYRKNCDLILKKVKEGWRD